MTVEGTAFKCGWLTDTPCAGCGAIGEQVWLSHPGDLCYVCRTKGEETQMMNETALAIVSDLEASLDEQHPSTGDLASYLEMGRAFVVATQDDLDTAAEVLGTLKASATALEAEEKKATAPLNASLKVIRGWFAPARKAAQDARVVWDAAYLAGRAKLAAQAAQAAQQVKASIIAGDSAGAALAHKLVTPPQPTQGTQVRKVWTFRVVNFAMVPDDYKEPAESLIRKEMGRAVALTGEPPVIPGIIFEQVEILAVTT